MENFIEYSLPYKMTMKDRLMQVIATSSALCLFTLFLWIFALSYLGLF